MVGEALFLLVDVELLDVVDHLLLEAVAVHLHFGDGVEAVDDAGAYLLHAGRLKGFYLCEQGAYVGNLLLELTLQRGALLAAEVHEGFDGAVCHAGGYGPLLIGELHSLAARQHVGQAQKRGYPAPLGLVEVVVADDAADLVDIGFQDGAVDGCGGIVVVALDVKAEVHLAALQLRTDECAQLHLLLAVDGGDARLQVEGLAVDGFNLCGYLLATELGRSLAVACHRENHSDLQFDNLQFDNMEELQYTMR